MRERIAVVPLRDWGLAGLGVLKNECLFVCLFVWGNWGGRCGFAILGRGGGGNIYQIN